MRQRGGTDRRRRTLVIAAAMLGVLVAASAPAVAQDAPSALVLLDRDGLRLTGTLEGTAAGLAHAGVWYGLARQFGGAGFADRRVWGEFAVAPGMEAVWQAAPDFALYGGLSVLAAGTLGRDAYDSGNRGAVLPENAYVGLRTTNPEGVWNLDISGGAQRYQVGTGMLIFQGAGNGFSRGAVATLPRRAFGNTAILRASRGGFSAEAFWLDANEVPGSDTHTELAGGVVQYRWDPGTRVGFSGFQAIRSTAVYPVAPAGLLEDAREGLVTWHGFGELDATRIGLPGASVRGEFALQRNDRINLEAHAWFAEVAYRFASLPWMPRLSYGYATFTGDDPGTRRIERFDPLFYGNGLDNWFFGAGGGYTVLNSNLDVHRVALDLVASERDFIKLLYLRLAANRTNSPIQFGQATQISADGGSLFLSSGVPTPHLADEVYAQWTRMLTPQVALTVWGSLAFPGAGLKAVGGDQTWQSAGLTLSVRF
ncbi:alginate export family protein [Falsiroseomonas sp.]|uniref:alginate export family protein n=1 Tax=Falsiroseomonas sp. TaxID=2870721 RepID=UPI003568A521